MAPAVARRFPGGRRVDEPDWISAALEAKRRVGAVHPALLDGDRRRDAAFNGDTATLERLAAAAPGSELAKVAEARAEAGLGLRPRGWRLGSDARVFDEQIEFGDEPAFVRSDPAWRDDALARGRTALDRLRAARGSDTCVIAGNGPSLNRTDLGQLDGRADLLISNYGFRHPVLRRRAHLLAVVNALVAEQESERLNLLEGPAKVFPHWLSHVMREECGAVFVRAPGGAPRFGSDPDAGFSWSSTVSFFLMQLAFWLGYRRALLVGFDHGYAQPAGAREGQVLVEAGTDPNHFDPAYFRGKRWQAADPDLMATAYRLAQVAWRRDGREIVNCTVGGALELFPRGDLAAQLAGADGAVEPAVGGPLSWQGLEVLGHTAEGDWGNVALAVDRLRFGPLFWPRLTLKLHRAPGKVMVEFRRDEGSPYVFASWDAAAPDHLLLGAGEARGGLALADGWLDAADRRALRAFLAAAPLWLELVLADQPGPLAPFADLTPAFRRLAREAG